MRVLLLLWVCLLAPAVSAQLTVVGHEPQRHAVAVPGASIRLDFDRPVDASTLNAASLRVFGRASGVATGSYALANGGSSVLFDPDAPFAAGETVVVNLSRDLAGADATPLRDAGYFFQFGVAVRSGSGVFQQIQQTVVGSNTTLYGAAAVDLDEDGRIDLATTNEATADVRVMLANSDGSGTFGTPLVPYSSVGLNASPVESTDFDADGHVDLVVGAIAHDAWVLLGNGDGSFQPAQQLVVGGGNRGVAVLDANGDAHPDVVSARAGGGGELELFLGDGLGGFAAPVDFDAGVAGAWAVAAGDMNHDGIADLVAGGRLEVAVLLGDGAGGFAAGPALPAPGGVWTLALGDIDGDGALDVAAAQGADDVTSTYLGDGAGGLSGRVDIATADTVPSVDLGDVDGDGDLDMMLPVFGVRDWLLYRNDGTGAFTLWETFEGGNLPSCSLLFDVDGDGDLDLVLTDEGDDDVRVLAQQGTPVPLPLPPWLPPLLATSLAGAALGVLRRAGSPRR